MNNSYQQLIEQNSKFPQENFKLIDSYLSFYDIPLKKLIDKYGTPFRITYLPKITEQIENARLWFEKSIKQHNYSGNYEYCYCTKCSHYEHIISKVLESGVNLETSSAFDIDIILNLYEKNEIPKNRTIIHNGFKTDEYLQKIIKLQNSGFTNSIVILDNLRELNRLEHWSKNIKHKIKIGLRMAINEESKSSFNSSRLGIPKDKLSSIFDMGCDFNRPGTENEKSTGMGLILSVEYAKLMKAKLTMSSVEGKGSTVCLLIPTHNIQQ